MKSSELGENTSAVEVTNISPFGVWLLIDDRERFLPYEKFPWFRDARVSEIAEVELLHGHHLHWPRLDVDLDIDSLDRPEAYPLVDQKPR